MKRMPMSDEGEHDVLTNARQYYCYTQRAGVTKKIKQRYNRKERKYMSNLLIKEGLDEQDSIM